MAAALRLVTEAALAGLDVGGYARDDPCDERAVERAIAIERGAVRARTGEPPRDDDLGRGRARRAFREPCRVREPGRIEERVLLVDAVVDDGHLDAVALRTCRRRELGSPDHGRALVEVEVIREARVDPGRDPRVQQGRQPAVWNAHREAVHEHLVPARHDRVRHRSMKPADRKLLLRRKGVQV